jgi:hypothetical protein
LQFIFPPTTNAPCVQTLHLPEHAHAALTPLGAAVHCPPHPVQLDGEKRRIAFSPQRKTVSAPRGCHP